jgi:hypothetical protein
MGTALRSKHTGRFLADSEVLDTVGGPTLSVMHLPQEVRRPAYVLAHELRTLCGSLERSPVGFSFIPERGGWIKLRDVDPALLERAIRKLERIYTTWRLPRRSRDVYRDVDNFLSGRAL